jgi:hypothetical protein
MAQVKAEEDAKNMSCGTRLAPHTGLETVNIFKALVAPAGYTSKHFSTFLEERLLQLGDKVPWKKKKVDARVLLEVYGFETISPRPEPRRSERHV